MDKKKRRMIELGKDAVIVLLLLSALWLIGRPQLYGRQVEEWLSSTRELLDRNGFGQRRLLRAFPQLRSLDHRAALERLRRRLDRR